MIWLLLVAQALFFMGLGVILLVLWESYRGNDAEFESVRRWEEYVTRHRHINSPNGSIDKHSEISKNPFRAE